MFDKYKIENKYLSIIEKKQYGVFVQKVKEEIIIMYSNNKENNKTNMMNNDEKKMKKTKKKCERQKINDAYIINQD